MLKKKKVKYFYIKKFFILLNNPNLMSKIFEYENQFILRVPENVADKLNKAIEKEGTQNSFLDLQPYLDLEPEGLNLKFKFNKCKN